MRWIERPIGNHVTVQTLSKELNSLPEPLTRFLILRGIDSIDAARDYFRATKEKLLDPHLLAEVKQAAERIARAIAEKENVLVYGDFDADGVTSTALLLKFLHSHGVTAVSYIPHRQKDNHGFHAHVVELARSKDCSLIIVADCGTNDEETAAQLHKAGIDLIICDHHENEDIQPICHAHVNPNRQGCMYPQKEISACALAFKMTQVTFEILGKPASLADQYLDLVAISTVCDIMPLVGENRILVREGLNLLRTSKHPGLASLISVSGCNQEHLSSTDIAMQLGPRLNAAGRLAHADEALALLMAESDDEGLTLAKRLDELNKSRKAHAAELRTVASKLARTQLAGEHTSALVLYNPDWHPGILGPAAAQMVREFTRPAVMLTDVPNSEKEVFGSARTWGKIHILKALIGCQDLLIKFGGHAKAAGMTLKKDDIPQFKAKFNENVHAQIGAPQSRSSLEYDAQLPLDIIPGKFERVLKLCQPFGKKNEPPLFLVENLHPESVRVLGGGHHLKMKLRAPNSSASLDAIGFGQSRHHKTAEEARIKKTGLDLLCYVEENRWNGRTITQLRFEALRAHSKSS